MIIRFLGTGSNGGLPQLDCRCTNCEAARVDTSIVRLRSCVAISEVNDKWIIIDCGPDFKTQMSRQGWILQDIDTIALTHLHSDHSIGLCELGFGQAHQIKINASNGLKQEIMTSDQFGHLFSRGFAKFDEFDLIKFIPISHWPEHDCSAIVIGTKKKILFASDCASIDNNLISEMRKVELVIFDGTFLNESKFNHLSIRKSCEILRNINVPVIFTHVNHSESLSEISEFIKTFNFTVAFDNMEVVI